MCNIVPKASEGAKSLEEVKERLKTQYGINLNIEQIKEIDAELERRKH